MDNLEVEIWVFRKRKWEVKTFIMIIMVNLKNSDSLFYLFIFQQWMQKRKPRPSDPMTVKFKPNREDQRGDSHKGREALETGKKKFRNGIQGSIYSWRWILICSLDTLKHWLNQLL